MPGFAVQGFADPVGGMTVPDSSKHVPSESEYYYIYMWEIFKIFEDTLESPPGARSALIHLKDMTLPTFTVNQETVLGASLEYKWAKSVTWDDIKVTWYDTVGMLQYLKEWRETIWTSMKGLKVASEYKKQSHLETFLPTGKSVQGWLLNGSWPKVIRHGEMTYTNSDVKTVEVTVAYDWAEELPPE